MIPNGGLDMECRRCGEPFVVEPASGGRGPSVTKSLSSLSEEAEAKGDTPPERTTVSAPPDPVVQETTRVGVANPVMDAPVLDTSARPLIGPGGMTYDSEDGDSDGPTEALMKAPKNGGPNHNQPTQPISTANVPPDVDEDGLNPELDDTIRVGVEDPAAPSPAITEPSQIAKMFDAPPLVGDPPPPMPIGSESNPSVYERVAAGLAGPEDKPRLRGLSQPSEVELKPTIEKSLRPIADLLNRAPLALKVGLIVFPVTLGIMLVVNSMGDEPKEEDAASITIPVSAAAQAAEKSADLPIDEPKPDAPVQEVADEPPADAPAPDDSAEPIRRPKVLEDPKAPDGLAYVQVDNARIRGRASLKSTISGRLAAGDLVKVYREAGGWTMILKEPDGPVGFISPKLLDDRKPLSVLAREQQFARCVVGEAYSRDDCLFSAKQQQDACSSLCVTTYPDEKFERLRCAQVCTIAFDDCARGCKKKTTTRRRRRRR